MGALDTSPTNTNFLSNLGFKVTIKKIPNVQFFVQEVNLPGIFLQPTEQANPMVRIPIAGDHCAFQELRLTFVVDEDMKNYLEIYNWIRALGFPESTDEYAAIAAKSVISGEGKECDIILSITNNKKNANYEATFRDAFPVDLTDLTFNTVSEDVQYLTATATFQYTLYNFYKLP